MGLEGLELPFVGGLVDYAGFPSKLMHSPRAPKEWASPFQSPPALDLSPVQKVSTLRRVV